MAKTLYLQMTYRCNLDCVFCASDLTNSPSAAGYDLHAVEHLLLQYPECDMVHFNGGEPTLCRGLSTLCGYAKSLNKYVILSTNAIRCSDRKYAAEIVGQRVDVISVPSYCCSEREYEELVRREGAFDSYIKGLQNLSLLSGRCGTRLIIKVLPLKTAIGQLHLLPGHWQQLGVHPDEVQISGLHIGRKARAHPEVIPDADELVEGVSALVCALADAQIPFSMCEVPWCLLENDALELAISHGTLHPIATATSYTRINIDGEKCEELDIMRFSVCNRCHLSLFCIGFSPRGFDLISDGLLKKIRPVLLDVSQD